MSYFLYNVQSGIRKPVYTGNLTSKKKGGNTFSVWPQCVLTPTVAVLRPLLFFKSLEIISSLKVQFTHYHSLTNFFFLYSTPLGSAEIYWQKPTHSVGSCTTTNENGLHGGLWTTKTHLNIISCHCSEAVSITGQIPFACIVLATRERPHWQLSNQKYLRIYCRETWYVVCDLMRFGVNWSFICAVHSVGCVLLSVVHNLVHSGSPIVSKYIVITLSGLTHSV